MGASLSVAAGTLDRRLRRRGAKRHAGAPDRPMVVGAPRPAVHHREPAGCQQQCRHRSGCEGTIGTANAISASVYDKLNFIFLRDIAAVTHMVRTPIVIVVNPAV